MRSAAALMRASERSERSCEHVSEARAAGVRTHRKERAGRAARRDLLKREERK